MMRIIPRSPGAYLLRVAGHGAVGWLKERTVRFNGFPSHRSAVAAAVQGGLALGAYAGGAALQAGPRAARPPNDAGDARSARAADDPAGVRLEYTGTYEWVFIDARAIARLVPPADVEVVPSVEEVLACGGHGPRPPKSGAFSIEFLLSENLSLDACLTIAQVLYAAVEHHRARYGAKAVADGGHAPVPSDAGR